MQINNKQVLSSKAIIQDWRRHKCTFKQGKLISYHHTHNFIEGTYKDITSERRKIGYWDARGKGWQETGEHIGQSKIFSITITSITLHRIKAKTQLKHKFSIA